MPLLPDKVSSNLSNLTPEQRKLLLSKIKPQQAKIGASNASAKPIGVLSRSQLPLWLFDRVRWTPLLLNAQ
jgi:hypothetical protein